MNPALTAMANALRVGDHLLERLGAGTGGGGGGNRERGVNAAAASAERPPEQALPEPLG